MTGIEILSPETDTDKVFTIPQVLRVVIYLKDHFSGEPIGKDNPGSSTFLCNYLGFT